MVQCYLVCNNYGEQKNVRIKRRECYVRGEMLIKFTHQNNGT